MKEAGHTDFDFTSLEGFLAAKVMLEGLHRSGHNLSRETLIAELERLHQWDMGGFTVSYSPTNHEGSHYTDLTIIGRGGRFVH
ncbi:MAG TPA: ABC transporter permease, partial [Ramlibacter sp.]|jgi:ABC-type branched-subunit amino acid transport system substrate-binding protein